MSERPVIAITMGDPSGIGPEVIAKVLSSHEAYDICIPMVIGNAELLASAAKMVNARLSGKLVNEPQEAKGELGTIDILDPGNLDPKEVHIGRLSPHAGRAAMEWVEKAAELTLAGKTRAIVTGPINKEAAIQGGIKDIGQTDLLQRVTGAAEVATMLMSRPLRAVHLTTHKSVRDACDYVKKPHILVKLQLIHRSFKEWGFPSPRIAVAALNPHAGEGGIMGREEVEEIRPAVQEAKASGIDAQGPIPADAVFGQAISDIFDVILVMYHDQGHIGVKVYGFERSVSVNLGLPIIRTSVDHGTAFDIAGKGIASSQSMLEAIKVAVALATKRGLNSK